MNKFMAAVFGLAATFNAAQAAEITGGSIELSYYAFTDDTDADKVTLEGSLEIGFNRNLSVQADLAQDSFGASNVDSVTLGLHGIYHVNEDTSFGAFYAREELDTGGLSGDIDLLGIEAGHEIGKVSLEGYLGRGEAANANGTIVGLSGRYGFDNGIGVTGSADYLDIDGVDIQNYAVRIDRDTGAHLNLFAEIGTARASAFNVSGSEPFVGIGGRYTFGADRGATFERRSLLGLLPGG